MLKKHKNIPQYILDIVSTLVLQVSVILSHSYLIIIYNIAMNKEELSNLKVSELKEIAKEKSTSAV